MLSSLLLVLSCALPGPPVLAPGLAWPLPQEATPIVDKRPAVKNLIAKLKEHVGKRGEEDGFAVDVVKLLSVEFAVSGPRDRADIVAALGKCLEQTRKPRSGDLPDNRLYVPVAMHLGKMGTDATKVLIKWIGNKKHRENLVLQRELILSLGKTKDLAAIKVLTALLNHKSESVIAWAGTAFAQFDKAPQKIRKKVFKDLLEILTTANTLKKTNGNDILARERYEAVAAPFMRTLGALSGQRFSKPEACERWWKENRRADWDKKKEDE